MVHSYGYRCGTRNKYSKRFRQKGMPAGTRWLASYRQGEFVDIIADPGVQQGLPHKYYHGLTGRVWQVTPRAVCVVVNKKVNGRVIPKKICVRTVHCRPSRCQSDFKERVKRVAALKKEAKEKGIRLTVDQLKRQPPAPAPSKVVKANVKPTHLGAEPFDFCATYKL
eukprot:NODE_3036_length_990_cov_1123.051010_g2536_i0.p2 GENE.NODE_3036_length_990_cov_1123.051010_g2536_i0~~NODE_3036_length_990_cov_1123.051010_g2536_i0.p2  ORF type:complete len:167 (+),score=54.22 NODE_3036_length_990_cov_1123.051010_g2536_i0:87-587(+)